MDIPALQITALPNLGDARGHSFMLPREALAFLGQVDHMHCAEILPNAVRGNHFHVGRKEAIVVLYRDAWILAWDEGDGTPVRQQTFEGTGAALVCIVSGAAHALKNTGGQTLYVTSMSDGDYVSSDTGRRVLIEI